MASCRFSNDCLEDVLLLAIVAAHESFRTEILQEFQRRGVAYIRAPVQRVMHVAYRGRPAVPEHAQCSQLSVSWWHRRSHSRIMYDERRRCQPGHPGRRKHVARDGVLPFVTCGYHSVATRG